MRALDKFIRELQHIQPTFVDDIHVNSDCEGVIYVEANYANSDDSIAASERMAKISTQLLLNTGIYIVLSPAVKEVIGNGIEENHNNQSLEVRSN